MEQKIIDLKNNINLINNFLNLIRVDSEYEKYQGGGELNYMKK